MEEQAGAARCRVVAALTRRNGARARRWADAGGANHHGWRFYSRKIAAKIAREMGVRRPTFWDKASAGSYLVMPPHGRITRAGAARGT